MKRQLRERLRLETNAELAESKIVHNDQSFIHELEDLLDSEKQFNDHKYSTGVKPQMNSKNGLHSTTSFNMLRQIKAKNQILKDHNAESILLTHRSRNKMDFIRNSEQTSDAYHQRTQLKARLIENDDREKRKSIKQPPFFEAKKQGENNNSLRCKFDYNRSSIPKVKQFLYKNVLQKCEHCGSVKSQIFRNNLVCKNRKCRLLHFYDDFQTFPLSAILYDIEMPSCNVQELEDLVKKIKEQITKIEEWRNSFMQLQFQIQNIIQSRKEFQKHNKNELKSLITVLTDLKSKKLKENQNQLASIRNQLERLELRQPYQQFNRWKKIQGQKFHHSKTISDLILKCKPLCLKTINSGIAEPMADISDNFNSLKVCLNASQFLSYNFLGDLSQMALTIDGSIQLKRDNFILIENLQELKLIFNSRKTSRELRELFNILPNANSIIFDFDFKFNSHLSSETFPLISSAFQLANKSIKINLLNARPEVFDDLNEASKISKRKDGIQIKIQMNPYIPETQWPQLNKSVDWGTRVVKNLIQNIGNKAVKIILDFPLNINQEEISQFLINGDYYLLTQLKLPSKSSENVNCLQSLLQKMTKKKKMLLGHLLSQKKHSSHALNKSRGLAQSVYQVLF